MSCVPPRPYRSPTPRGNPLPLVNVRTLRDGGARVSSPGSPTPNNALVCTGSRFVTRSRVPVPDVPVPDVPVWRPDALGRVVFRVFNSNSILDDAWAFFANGIPIGIYSGDGSAELVWSANIPAGQALTFTAECVIEQNDNFFEYDVTISGVAILGGYIDGPGEVGETLVLGTIIT